MTWLPGYGLAAFVDRGQGPLPAQPPAAPTEAGHPALAARLTPQLHPRALLASTLEDLHSAGLAGQPTSAVLWLPTDVHADVEAGSNSAGARASTGRLGLAPWRTGVLALNNTGVAAMTSLARGGQDLHPAPAPVGLWRRQGSPPPPATVATGTGSLMWLADALDLVEPLLGAGLFMPEAHHSSPLRYRDPVQVGVRLWDCPGTAAAVAEAAETMPGLLLAAHPARATREQVARAVLEQLAGTHLRALLADQDTATYAGNQTSDGILDVLRAGPSAGASTFPAKPTSARVLAALETWATQPEPGQRLAVTVSLLAPAGDPEATNALADADWAVEMLVVDAANPVVPVDLDELDAADLAALLGPAAAAWPALSDGAPLITLPAAMVATWLTQTAPALREAGVNVSVPQWLRPARSATTTLRAQRTQSTGLFGLDTLVSASLSVIVDGQELTGSALDTALRTRLANVEGTWVLLDDKVVRRLRRLARDCAGGQMDTRALLALRTEAALNVTGSAERLEQIDIATNDAFLARLMTGAAPTDLVPVPDPAAVTSALRSYQQAGLAWLCWLTENGFGGLLADDMGLGKTMQVLALLAAEREGLCTPAWGQPTTTLVVTTPSGLQPWLNQPAQHVPTLKVGHWNPKTDPAQVAADLDVLLVTYDQVRVHADRFAAARFDRAVFDEATKLKNPGTAITRAARALNVAQVLLLTGTPVENRLGDLHTLVSLANNGLLGSRAQFDQAFAAPIGDGGTAVRAAADQLDGDLSLAREVAIDRLKGAYGPFYLRRRKDEYKQELGLPDKHMVVVDVALTAEQHARYALECQHADSVVAADPRARQSQTLRLITRLLQVCDHPNLLPGLPGPVAGRSGKLDALDSIVRARIDAGEKVIVFSRFAEMVTMLAEYLRAHHDVPVFAMTGAVSAKRRLADLASFSAVDGAAVYVLSTMTGAHALDMTAATHVVHYDRWWNPAVEDQANDRAYRIGQTQDVTVHLLVSDAGLERNMDALLSGKRALAADVTGAGAVSLLAGLGRLSKEELMDLVRMQEVRGLRPQDPPRTVPSIPTQPTSGQDR